MAPSFNDIRAALTDALAADDKDKGDDLIVVDAGPDWVVYRDPDTVGAGLYRRSYKMDGDKAVLTSDPEKVVRQTTYTAASDSKSEDPPKTLSDAAEKAKSAFAKRRQERDNSTK